MPTLYLNTTPANAPTPRDLPEGGVLLTPNAKAARTWHSKPCTLEDMARATLRAQGWRVASLLQSQRSLQQAVQAVQAPEDVEGSLRQLFAPVRALLRANASAYVADTGQDTGKNMGQWDVRLEQLLELSRHYQYLLAAQGLVDPAALLWKAAQHCVAKQCVHLREYPWLGAGELAFLQALAAPDSSLSLAAGTASATAVHSAVLATLAGWQCITVPATQAKQAMTPGAQLARRFAGESAPLSPEVLARVRVYSYPDSDAEVRGALQRVKVLLQQGVSAEDIVLVSRDEASYAPLLRAVAEEYRLPLRCFDRVALIDTQLGAWLQLLAGSLQENGAFAPVSQLLGHSLSQFDDAALWSLARSQRPNNFAAWAALGLTPALCTWPQQASAAQHWQQLEAILASFQLAVSSSRQRREKAAWHSLQRLGRHLAFSHSDNSNDSNDTSDANGTATNNSRMSRRQFLAALLEGCRLLSVLHDPPPLGKEATVALHSPLALFGARYRHVIIMGLAEGVFPAMLRDDPVLDFYSRKQLQAQGIALEDAQQAAERERLSFWTLLQVATETLQLSYPQYSYPRRQLPGAHLQALALPLLPAPPLAPASLEEARTALLPYAPTLPADLDPLLPEVHHAWQVELRRESAAPPDAYDGILGIGLEPSHWRFSASQFTMLGQCPFRWFAAKLLQLRDADDDEAEGDSDALRPDVRGRFYHKVLQRTLEPARTAAEPRAVALAAFDDAFAEAEQEEQLATLPHWPAQRQEHYQVLRRALRAKDFFPEQGRVMALEQSFYGSWQGLQISGVLDRIDSTPQGLWLCDYKSSQSKPPGIKDAAGKAKIDVQLSLYQQVALPALYPEQPLAQAGYYALTKPKFLSERPPEAGVLETFAEQLKERLRQGHYPVDPDVDGVACRYCAFDVLCRKGTRLQRKQPPEVPC